MAEILVRNYRVVDGVIVDISDTPLEIFLDGVWIPIDEVMEGLEDE